MSGAEGAVQIHIERGDDLDARDANGMTPLMLAATRNKASICKLLLDAGADYALTDSKGRDAHAIAIEAGSVEAAAIIGSARPATAEPHDPASPDAPAETGESPSQEQVFDDDGFEFDMSDWKPEVERPPPEADPSVSEAAIAIQTAISEFELIDSSADWGDLEAYLPERASPLPSEDDAEWRRRLRLMLLRALREGSVPAMAVENLSNDARGAARGDVITVLTMVLNDLGAELDERFEYSTPFDDFEVDVNPEEAPDEEVEVDDALAFVGDLTSYRNEPLRIYQREIQREKLLSAEQEVELAQAMENSVQRALDALASWPGGIGRTLDAARAVKSGEKPFAWISLGPRSESHEVEADADDEVGSASAFTLIGADEGSEPHSEPEAHLESPAAPDSQDAVDFFISIDKLSELPIDTNKGSSSWSETRSALASLCLTRRFLVDLADFASEGGSVAEVEFIEAVREHQSARGRMAIANLKLVFSLALKGLYSGELLDDLIQEGNLGLLRAIELYDWRRGFKFSTYATWWIRQHISRHIADKLRTIRLPVHIHQRLQKIARIASDFQGETGRPPELDEIASRARIEPDKVKALLRIAHDAESVEGLDLDDLIAADARDDYIARDPMDITAEGELIGSIDRILSTLSRKEERVVRMRFGLGVDSMTLEEIGMQLEVTRERIRQIEAKAIKRLQHPTRAAPLMREVKGRRLPESYGDRPETESDDVDVEADLPRATESGKREAAPTAAGGTDRPAAPSSHLDLALEEAKELGFIVDDDRYGTSGRIWVNIADTPDNRYRQMIRKLIGLGFVVWPGEGLWK
ncbi:sigma-70 family RNA polymerase sigma factor [Thiomonas sp. X19]|uniref:sigma-70 family RNA polymerase sigma factor n=1 Tax=Thiomonas sp. X19 TaxID=1050370 RepID=UPI0013145592